MIRITFIEFIDLHVHLLINFFIIQVDAANPPFPRPTAHWWFGCKNAQASGEKGNMFEEQINSNSNIVEDTILDAGK